MCRVCGRAGDKRNMRGLFSSCGHERGIAERLSKLSGVEVCSSDGLSYSVPVVLGEARFTTETS